MDKKFPKLSITKKLLTDVSLFGVCGKWLRSKLVNITSRFLTIRLGIIDAQRDITSTIAILDVCGGPSSLQKYAIEAQAATVNQTGQLLCVKVQDTKISVVSLKSDHTWSFSFDEVIRLFKWTTTESLIAVTERAVFTWCYPHDEVEERFELKSSLIDSELIDVIATKDFGWIAVWGILFRAFEDGRIQLFNAVDNESCLLNGYAPLLMEPEHDTFGCTIVYSTTDQGQDKKLNVWKTDTVFVPEHAQVTASTRYFLPSVICGIQDYALFTANYNTLDLVVLVSRLGSAIIFDISLGGVQQLGRRYAGELNDRCHPAFSINAATGELVLVTYKGRVQGLSIDREQLVKELVEEKRQKMADQITGRVRTILNTIEEVPELNVFALKKLRGGGGPMFASLVRPKNLAEKGLEILRACRPDTNSSRQSLVALGILANYSRVKAFNLTIDEADILLSNSVYTVGLGIFDCFFGFNRTVFIENPEQPRRKFGKLFVDKFGSGPTYSKWERGEYKQFMQHLLCSEISSSTGIVPEIGYRYLDGEEAEFDPKFRLTQNYRDVRLPCAMVNGLLGEGTATAEDSITSFNASNLCQSTKLGDVGAANDYQPNITNVSVIFDLPIDLDEDEYTAEEDQPGEDGKSDGQSPETPTIGEATASHDTFAEVHEDFDMDVFDRRERFRQLIKLYPMMRLINRRPVPDRPDASSFMEEEKPDEASTSENPPDTTNRGNYLSVPSCRLDISSARGTALPAMSSSCPADSYMPGFVANLNRVSKSLLEVSILDKTKLQIPLPPTQGTSAATSKDSNKQNKVATTDPYEDLADWLDGRDVMDPFQKFRCNTEDYVKAELSEGNGTIGINTDGKVVWFYMRNGILEQILAQDISKI